MKPITYANMNMMWWFMITAVMVKVKANEMKLPFRWCMATLSAMRKMYASDSIILYGEIFGYRPCIMACRQYQSKSFDFGNPLHRYGQPDWRSGPGVSMHWFLNYKFDNLAQLTTLNLPVFIIHGTNDQLISVDHARKLASVCTHPASQLIIIPNGGHNNLRSFDTYQKVLSNFCPPSGLSTKRNANQNPYAVSDCCSCKSKQAPDAFLSTKRFSCKWGDGSSN